MLGIGFSRCPIDEFLKMREESVPIRGVAAIEKPDHGWPFHDSIRPAYMRLEQVSGLVDDMLWRQVQGRIAG
jgi:hypothetical protein